MSPKDLIWVLWPSFLVAGIAEAVFFTTFDPNELLPFGEPLGWSRTAIYSIGFFAFWIVTVASSLLSCFLWKTSTEIDRRPPAGAPKPEEGD